MTLVVHFQMVSSTNKNELEKENYFIAHLFPPLLLVFRSCVFC